MYCFVLAALNQVTVARFMDLISQPLANDKYKALKTWFWSQSTGAPDFSIFAR